MLWEPGVNAHDCACGQAECDFGCGPAPNDPLKITDLEKALDALRGCAGGIHYNLTFNPNLGGDAACTCATNMCNLQECYIDVHSSSFSDNCGTSVNPGNEYAYCITQSNLTIDGGGIATFRYVGKGMCNSDPPNGCCDDDGIEPWPSCCEPFGDAGLPCPLCSDQPESKMQPQLFRIFGQGNTVRNFYMRFFPEGVHFRGPGSQGNTVSGMSSNAVCEEAVTVDFGTNHTLERSTLMGYTLNPDPNLSKPCGDNIGLPAPCGLDKAIQINGASGTIGGDTPEKGNQIDHFRAPVRVHNNLEETIGSGNEQYYTGDWVIRHNTTNVNPYNGNGLPASDKPWWQQSSETCPSYPNAGYEIEGDLAPLAGGPTRCAHVCQGYEVDELLSKPPADPEEDPPIVRYAVEFDDNDIRYCRHGLSVESGARVRARRNRFQHNYVAGVFVKRGGTDTDEPLPPDFEGETEDQSDNVNVRLLMEENVFKRNGYVMFDPEVDNDGDPDADWPLDCLRGNVVVHPTIGASPEWTRIDLGRGDHDLRSIFDGSNCSGASGDGVTCSDGLNESCQAIGDPTLQTLLGDGRLVDVANCGDGPVGAAIGFQRGTFDASGSLKTRVADSAADVPTAALCGSSGVLAPPALSTCPVRMRCGDGSNWRPLSRYLSNALGDCSVFNYMSPSECGD
jgi:hypothetical protein